MADVLTREWQVAEGSRTLHLLDAALPPRRGEPGWRKSGPRAACGRYPQRNQDGIWAAWPADDPKILDGVALGYSLTVCADCREEAPDA